MFQKEYFEMIFCPLNFLYKKNILLTELDTFAYETLISESSKIIKDDSGIT